MSAYGVSGDPVGMRHLAAQSREKADTLRATLEMAQRSIDQMHFDAPAARRLREQVAADAERTRTDAQALAAFADHLVQGANRVEHEVAARRAAEAERQRRSRGA